METTREILGLPFVGKEEDLNWTEQVLRMIGVRPAQKAFEPINVTGAYERQQKFACSAYG